MRKKDFYLLFFFFVFVFVRGIKWIFPQRLKRGMELDLLFTNSLATEGMKRVLSRASEIFLGCIVGCAIIPTSESLTHGKRLRIFV